MEMELDGIGWKRNDDGSNRAHGVAYKTAFNNSFATIANTRGKQRRSYERVYEFICVSCIFRHTYTWNSTLGGRGIPYRVPCWPRLSSLSLLLVLVLFRVRERKAKYVFTDNLLSSLPTSFTTDKRSFDHRQCRFSDVRHRKENSMRNTNRVFAIPLERTSSFPDPPTSRRFDKRKEKRCVSMILNENELTE